MDGVPSVLPPSTTMISFSPGSPWSVPSSGPRRSASLTVGITTETRPRAFAQRLTATPAIAQFGTSAILRAGHDVPSWRVAANDRLGSLATVRYLTKETSACPVTYPKSAIPLTAKTGLILTAWKSALVGRGLAVIQATTGSHHQRKPVTSSSLRMRTPLFLINDIPRYSAAASLSCVLV